MLIFLDKKVPSLPDKIKILLKERQISSPAELERLAGLKSGAARNVLNGTSKNPRVDTIVKIAGALSCSVDNLTDENATLFLDVTKGGIWDRELHVQCVTTIANYAGKLSLSLSFSQACSLVAELYFYSQETDNPSSVDENFAMWLLRSFQKKKTL